MSPPSAWAPWRRLDGALGGAWAGLGREQLDYLDRTLSDWGTDQPVVIFTHNPLYEYYPPWNFWVRDWREVHEIVKPYTKITNIHGHTHQVLYNEIGAMRSIGMLATSWPWPYAPEGVPALTKPMIRVDPGDHFDGVGWGKMTFDPQAQRIDHEYMMWRKEVLATAQVDSGSGDNDTTVLVAPPRRAVTSPLTCGSVLGGQAASRSGRQAGPRRRRMEVSDEGEAVILGAPRGRGMSGLRRLAGAAEPTSPGPGAQGSAHAGAAQDVRAGLFMEQVKIGDLLFHGDPATADKLRVKLSNTGWACAMCHPFASDTHPAEFPKWQEQMSKFATLRDMINWCIEKPNQGEKIDPDGQAMKALEAYITWSNRNSPLSPARTDAGWAPCLARGARRPARRA